MRVVVLLLVLVVLLTGMGWNDEEYFTERNNLPKYNNKQLYTILIAGSV